MISKKNFEEAFSGLWERLFLSPIHLDSALSKLSPSVKSTLAQIVPAILLRPVSQAELLGIGIPPEEPWSLSREQLARWRPALLMAERMREAMSGKMPVSEPREEDFPPEMVKAWRSQWGEAVTRQIIEVLGKEAPLSLRASHLTNPQELLKKLKAENSVPVRSSISQLVPFGVRLESYAPVLKTKAYEEGLFEIQDEGSQLMALFALWPDAYQDLLKSSPGHVESKKTPSYPFQSFNSAQNVVDTCAGAGGKSLALADALKGKARVFSYDVSDKKLQALRRRAKRAGLRNIQTLTLPEGNESEKLKPFYESAQVVLVDAPCSGWGVLRRNPDAKWRQTSETLSKMPEIQLRLLREYSKLVVPGGQLIYGVCTFRPEETKDLVTQFLEEAGSEFELKAGGYLGPGPCDGFFMQCLNRKK